MGNLNYKIIGERLRKLRKYFGLSQAQVASILNISEDIISSVEKGKKINLEEIVRFSKLYCISFEELTNNNFFMECMRYDGVNKREK